MLKLCALLLAVAGTIDIVTSQVSQNANITGRSFIVGYNDNCFLKDGKCFRYISGALHYFRIPRAYWMDRMLKLKAAGLNALQTYVEWSSHEPEPGVYDFSGDLDMLAYIKMAQDLGFLVILRASPYIDAERDMGGLPYWLLRMNKTMVLRSSDPTYMFYVERYYSKLLPMIRPLTYGNGGPIISVQIENEYGSYFACDRDYTARLRYVLEQGLGPDVLFFTTDGAGDGFILCGQVDGAYTTVDFGSGGDVQSSFAPLRKREPRGPLVNSEYYPGWIDHWGAPHSLVSASQVAKTLDEMLALNASVNIYVMHGGTSFGYMAGANEDGNQIIFCPTSYDFDAPINEAGDLTDKYMQIRTVIGKYLPLPPGPLPANSTKISFGPVHLTRVKSVFNGLESTAPVVNKFPLTFEELGQSKGFVLYQSKVDFITTDPVLLSIPGIRDRGYVFVDQTFQGILSRGEQISSMPVLIRPGQNLTILVENQGRICYGSNINDFKGILGNVTLGKHQVLNWIMWTLPIFQDKPGLHSNFDLATNIYPATAAEDEPSIPAFYSGTFTLPSDVQPSDTFLNVDKWYKGVASLNGFNLGRYWPVMGPQSTLYVPGFLLKPSPQMNIIILFELENAPCPSTGTGCNINFVDTPNINSQTPSSANNFRKANKFQSTHSES